MKTWMVLVFEHETSILTREVYHPSATEILYIIFPQQFYILYNTLLFSIVCYILHYFQFLHFLQVKLGHIKDFANKLQIKNYISNLDAILYNINIKYLK